MYRKSNHFAGDAGFRSIQASLQLKGLGASRAVQQNSEPQSVALPATQHTAVLQFQANPSKAFTLPLPKDLYCVLVWVREGTLLESSAPQGATLRAGRLHLFTILGGLSLESQSGASGALAAIPVKALGPGAMIQHPGVCPTLFQELAEFHPSDPGCPPSARLLANCLSSMRIGNAAPELPGQDLELQNLIRLLLSELLRTRVSTVTATTGPVQSSDGEPWFVRVIEQFLADHVAESFSVEDLAEIAGVRPRTLHEGFRKHRGYSPNQFLRDRRLQMIHKELSSPNHQTSVTECALRWGMKHLGRFSSLYLEAFGEKPSETLRKSRRRYS